MPSNLTLIDAVQDIDPIASASDPLSTSCGSNDSDIEAAVVKEMAHRSFSLKALVEFLRRLPEAMPHYDYSEYTLSF